MSKQLITEPIDFADLDPQIEDELRKGNKVKGVAWDNYDERRKECFLLNYVPENDEGSKFEVEYGEFDYDFRQFIEPIYKNESELITEPMDYSGLNPQIADELRRRNKVRGKVWLKDAKSATECFLVDYLPHPSYPYLLLLDGESCPSAYGNFQPIYKDVIDLHNPGKLTP